MPMQELPDKGADERGRRTLAGNQLNKLCVNVYRGRQCRASFDALGDGCHAMRIGRARPSTPDARWKAVLPGLRMRGVAFCVCDVVVCYGGRRVGLAISDLLVHGQSRAPRCDSACRAMLRYAVAAARPASTICFIDEARWRERDHSLCARESLRPAVSGTAVRLPSRMRPGLSLSCRDTVCVPWLCTDG